jgi:ribosomal protein L11 methylase PrmA
MLLYEATATGGIVIMSGLLHDDENIIIGAAAEKGLIHNATERLGDWSVLIFNK